MSTPIIFSTFANDKDDHLDLLKEESSAIKSALVDVARKEYIKIEGEESLDLNELVEILLKYQNQLLIFHYGGHANGTQLRLESGNANAKGLAQLLGEQENLQLVFLNGCSTRGQVDLLLEMGVKAVIATSIPIADPMAKDFAAAFYQALAEKRTLKRAFLFAKGVVESRYENSPSIFINRTLGSLKKQKAERAPELEEEEEEIPWGLYVQEDQAQAIYRWRLPFYRDIGLPSTILSHIRQYVKTNKFLVLALDDMCKFNEDIHHQKWETIGGIDRKIDSSAYLNLVIRNFPWIIGSQIRLLRFEEYIQPSQARLEQLISTYIISSQVVYFIMLSDLWNQISNNASLQQRIQPIQLPQESNLLQYPFLEKALAVFHQMEEADIELFAPELEHFFIELTNEKSNLAKSIQFLEAIRTNDLMTENGASKCEQTEKALTILLKRLAFLSGYSMLAVRDINIDNQRFSALEYELDMGRMNAEAEHGLTIYDDATNRRRTTYSNNRSIILVSTEQKVHRFLNLSPFLMDKNTYKGGELIDPHLFAFEKEGVYHYISIKHGIFTALKNEKGTDILHTNMTDLDFQEGTNITKQEQALDFFEDEFEEEHEFVEEGIPIFAALERQLEQFKSDFARL